MITEFETVDEFLEHFGTKGMRWGVRKQTSIDSGGGKPSSSKPAKSSDGKFVSKQQQHRGLTSGQKTALVVGGGVAAVLVARLILKNRRTKINTIKASEFSKGLSQAQKFAKTIGKTSASSPIVSSANPFRTPAGLFGTL